MIGISQLCEAMLAGFIIGSIPFASLILSIGFDLNIKDFGSGNPGVTNAYRILLPRLGKLRAMAVTLCIGLLDLSKGIVPGLLFNSLATSSCMCAVLGHMYSPFLGFSGGLGVTTFFGAFIGITRSLLFLIAPILWSLFSFVPSLLSWIPCDGDWIIVGRLRIKRSFFTSFLCMTLSLSLACILSGSIFYKLQLITMWTLITFKHRTHYYLT